MQSAECIGLQEHGVGHLFWNELSYSSLQVCLPCFYLLRMYLCVVSLVDSHTICFISGTASNHWSRNLAPIMLLENYQQ